MSSLTRQNVECDFAEFLRSPMEDRRLDQFALMAGFMLASEACQKLRQKLLASSSVKRMSVIQAAGSNRSSPREVIKGNLCRT